jgi:hypothetical protein
MISSRDNFRKIIEESKALERIGRVIKTRTFPSVTHSLHISNSISSDHQNEPLQPKLNLPMLKVANETYKTLPSINHSSYQKYRQSPHLKEIVQLEPISVESMWSVDTCIPSTTMFTMEKTKRTQIAQAEIVFGSKTGRRMSEKGRQRRKKEVNEKFERYFNELKIRSEKRAIESLNAPFQNRNNEIY